MYLFQNKKCYKPISRILSLVFCKRAIIYLFCNLRCKINLPTLPNSMAAFCRVGKKLGFTWHFSIQGLPETAITTNFCELLPHIFTFAPLLAG